MSRWGVTAGVPTIDGNNAEFRLRYPTVPQGISADLIATLEGFNREMVDTYAAQSQSRAATAIEERRFDRSLIEVITPDGSAVAGGRPAGYTTSSVIVPVGRQRRSASLWPPRDSLWLLRFCTGMPSTSTSL